MPARPNGMNNGPPLYPIRVLRVPLPIIAVYCSAAQLHSPALFAPPPLPSRLVMGRLHMHAASIRASHKWSIALADVTGAVGAPSRNTFGLPERFRQQSLCRWTIVMHKQQ